MANALKKKTEPAPVNSTTQTSLNKLTEHSFREVIQMMNSHHDYTITEIASKKIEKHQMYGAMLTISTSYYRIVVLFHFHPLSELNQYTRSLLDEHAKSNQAYLDYVCELGNNLCGSACRLLGAQGLTTGMSTPTLLENLNSPTHITAIGADVESHIACHYQRVPQFAASYYVFANKNVPLFLDYTIADHVEQEDTGELEFF